VSVLKYGLIGKSLKHSFSPHFFSELFAKKEVRAVYENLEFESENKLIEFFTNEVYKFKGLNVTIPYKEKVVPLLDEIHGEANEIGAVNTIKIENNKCIGYNTDCYGFQQCIKPFLTNKHERALVIGTGGASKAVYYVLNKLGINVLFISRKGTGADNRYPYNAMNKNMIDACKLIVNCSPVGMTPYHDEELEFPYKFLTAEHLVVDLIYNPEKTLFLQKSEKSGASILNGKSMLKEQALKSWEIWNE
jgi:shikimate dehydrogenase